ncbi:MAG TPA: DUF2345 domain-containing protein, partial [Variovorax sp.]|nr:DUF2345 domain-containing protein [Variovorax sp.]
GQGLLLSTEARPNAQGHLTDMPETLARLTEGRDLHESLGQTAQAAKAHEAGDQDEVAKALQEQNDALQGQGGHREQGLFPEFQEPHLTLASPAGIQTTTQGSTHLVSGAHTALTSGAHTSVATGNSFLVSAKNAVRLSAAQAGIRLTAAKDDIDIMAMKASIHALAKLNLKLEANRITITARDEVVINGGSSYTRWNAQGIESGTDGQWRAHAASHGLVGPDNKPVPPMAPATVALKETPPDPQIAFSMQHVPGLSPMLFAGQAYTLLKNGAEIRKGLFDEYGRLIIEQAEKGARYQVRLFNGTVHDVPVAQDRMERDPGQSQYNEHQLSNKGYRGDGQDSAKRRTQRERGSDSGQASA